MLLTNYAIDNECIFAYRMQYTEDRQYRAICRWNES